MSAQDMLAHEEIRLRCIEAAVKVAQRNTPAGTIVRRAQVLEAYVRSGTVPR